MAKKGNRVQVILECTEHKNSGLPGTSRYVTTKNKKKFIKYHNNFKMVRNKIIEVEERDNIRNFQPPITGQEIMTTFKVKPSKVIGTLKEIIKEAILEGDIPNEYNAAYELMINEAKKLGLKK